MCRPTVSPTWVACIETDFFALRCVYNLHQHAIQHLHMEVCTGMLRLRHSPYDPISICRRNEFSFQRLRYSASPLCAPVSFVYFVYHVPASILI